MMKNYIVYDKGGTILKSGACPEEMMPYQKIADSDCVIEGVTHDATHRIDISTGKIVHREPDTLPVYVPVIQVQPIEDDLIKRIDTLETIPDIKDFLKTLCNCIMVKYG